MKFLEIYINHFKAMPKDIATAQDVRDELEWLAENGFTKEVKKGIYDKTYKGKRLQKILDKLEGVE